jgi:hypothetical protein
MAIHVLLMSNSDNADKFVSQHWELDESSDEETVNDFIDELLTDLTYYMDMSVASTSIKNYVIRKEDFQIYELTLKFQWIKVGIPID